VIWRAPATLEALDAFLGDLVVAGVYADERPLRGVAGLVDWRTGTWLTHALRQGWLAGAPGEALLFPPGRRLGVRAVAAVGLGPAAGFDAARAAAAATHVAELAAGLGARKLCLEPPGRDTAGAEALRRALDAALPDAEALLLG